MRLEIRWIEDLLALEKYRTFSKAAEARYISQSAFTRRIQQVEEMVGAEILHRQHHQKTEFTEIGQILLSVSKNIMGQLQEVESLIHHLNGQESTIRFSVAHSLASGFLSQFLKQLSFNIAQYKIEITATNIDEGLALLKEGATDFMICYGDASNIERLAGNTLNYIKIAETAIVPVISREQQHQENMNLQAFFPLLTYSHHAYLRHVVDHLIAGKLKYKVMYETDIASNLKELVLRGLGIAWLAKIIIEDELKLDKLLILDEPKYHISQDIFIFKNKFNQNQMIQALWQHLPDLG